MPRDIESTIIESTGQPYHKAFNPQEEPFNKPKHLTIVSWFSNFPGIPLKRYRNLMLLNAYLNIQNSDGQVNKGGKKNMEIMNMNSSMTKHNEYWGNQNK